MPPIGAGVTEPIERQTREPDLTDTPEYTLREYKHLTRWTKEINPPHGLPTTGVKTTVPGPHARQKQDGAFVTFPVSA